MVIEINQPGGKLKNGHYILCIEYLRGKYLKIDIVTLVLICVFNYIRYGSPGSAAQEYQLFAAFYVKTFSNGIIEIILSFLDKYRNKVYIPPRVMQMGLNYLNQW